MKIKTSELTGPALRWAVAKANHVAVTIDCSVPSYPLLVVPGEEKEVNDFYLGYAPDTDWSQGGPIIEREKITCIWTPKSGFWSAYDCSVTTQNAIHSRQNGPTALVAAMRCYVASELGNEMDVPEELL